MSSYKAKCQKKSLLHSNVEVGSHEIESSTFSQFSLNPIYLHYSSRNELSPQFNESEFNQAMEEARLSYKSWKQMRDRLKKSLPASSVD